MHIPRSVLSALPLALTAALGAQTTYGTATAGSGGFLPRCWFAGSVSPGSTFDLTMDRALAGAPAFAILGFVPTSVSAAGIEVFVQPLVTQFVGLTSGAPGTAGAGTASMAITVPNANSFLGLPIRSQWLIADAGGPQGLAASDALAVEVVRTPLVVAAGTAGSLDRVYALDPTTGVSVNWNTAIGADNPVDVQFTPNGEICLVSATLSRQFVIADATNGGANLGAVSAGQALPNSAAITPDGLRAYGVTGGPQGSGLGHILEIDLDPTSPTFGTQVGQVTGVPFLSQLEGVDISDDGKILAAVNLGLGQTPMVLFVDIDPLSPTYNTVIQTGLLPTMSTDVQLNVDGSLAFVVQTPLGGSGWVLIIDSATGYPIATLASVGAFPTDVERHPLGDFVVVACPNSNEVWRVDTGGGLPTMALTVPGKPFAVALAPDGRTGWCTDQNGTDVYEFDTATMALLQTVTIGTGGGHAICVR